MPYGHTHQTRTHARTHAHTHAHTHTHTHTHTSCLMASRDMMATNTDSWRRRLKKTAVPAQREKFRTAGMIETAPSRKAAVSESPVRRRLGATSPTALPMISEVGTSFQLQPYLSAILLTCLCE